MSVDTSVTILGIRFRNAVWSASGCYAYGEETGDFYDPALLGAVVTKGISLEPRIGNNVPRIYETPAGMLNAIGLQNVGADAFLAEKMPFLRAVRSRGGRVVVNFLGRTPEEYATLAERLDRTDGIDALEMNLSCPNIKEGGISFGGDPRLMHEVVTLTRGRVHNLPIIVKLSPNVTDIGLMARTAVGAGADAVSLVNTFVGMAVDVRRRRPVLANVTGGLSGPAIKPLALRMVMETAKAVQVPIIGMGGIESAEDAAAFLLCGADCVQVGTAGYVNPHALPEIADGLTRLAEEHGYDRVSRFTRSLDSAKR